MAGPASLVSSDLRGSARSEGAAPAVAQSPATAQASALGRRATVSDSKSLLDEFNDLREAGQQVKAALLDTHEAKWFIMQLDKVARFLSRILQAR